MSQVNIHSFRGMNNITGLVQEGVAIPDNMVNAIPNMDGEITLRPGYTKELSLSGASDIWKSTNGRVYIIANNWLNLLDIDNLVLTPLVEITLIDGGKVYYVNYGEIDFISNTRFIYAYENSAIRDVGQTLDDLAMMDWQTTENGRVLYLQASDGQQTTIPHPAEFAHKPDPMKFLCEGHGRLWGAIGNKVFYSHPSLVEWWEYQNNFFEFLEDITLIAPVQGGVFIGTTNSLAFLQGSSPEEMQLISKKWVGVSEHSLVKAPALVDAPADSPTWMSVDGVVTLGLPDGSIRELTREVIKANPAAGAAGHINIEGVSTLLYRIEE